MRTSNFTTFYFQLLHFWHYDFQLPTFNFFTSDSVRDEAGSGEGVENICALDALLICWGGRK